MINTLIWYLENIRQQLLQMTPCMIAALLCWLLLRPARLRALKAQGLTSPMRREGVLLLFVLFCTGLCALTLFPYGFWSEILYALPGSSRAPKISFPPLRESLRALRELPDSITPFREILRVDQGGPWLWFVLWGNIGMFAPIGFCVPLLWRGKRWYHAVLAGGLFSVMIEFVQVFVGRVSDIDDVMLNTLGAVVGFILYFILCKVFKLDLNKFHCQKEEGL